MELHRLAGKGVDYVFGHHPGGIKLYAYGVKKFSLLNIHSWPILQKIRLRSVCKRVIVGDRYYSTR